MSGHCMFMVRQETESFLTELFIQQRHEEVGGCDVGNWVP